MTVSLKILIPIIAAVISLVVGFIVLLKRQKSLLSKSILLSTPAVALLQIGTFILLSHNFSHLKLVGGKFVLISLSVLTPICTKIAVLLYGSNGTDVLKKFKPILIFQRLISFGFIALILIDRVIFLIPEPALESPVAFDTWGQFFLIYLIVSSILILAIFENKLRILRNSKEARIPIIIFMGTFIFFIIMASQGLLIRTLNSNLLLVISFSIILGYLLLTFLSFKNYIASDRLFVPREAVYSSFMLLIVGSYLIVIGFIGKLMAIAGGNIQLFFTLIAASAVMFIFFMIITSFSLKEKIRRFVDKTFYQGRYDYRTLWSVFSERVSFCLSLDELSDSILNIITDILHVENMALLFLLKNNNKLILVKKKI